MRRRSLLATASALLSSALAGCVDGGGADASLGVAEAPAARLEMEPIDDAALPSRVCYSIEEGNDDRARQLDGILDDGATMEGLNPPFPANQHVAYDDAVYELSMEVVERTPATGFSVKVDVYDAPEDEGRTVQFAELPAVDRERFAAVGLADGDPVGIGTTFLYTDAQVEQSVLVPEPDYSVIAWEDGTRAEWVVDDSFDTTLKTYRYAAEEVAPAAAYGRRMRERFAFALEGLPDAERAVVETAIEEGGYAVEPDATPSSAFRALADRFRAREQARALDEDGGSESEDDPSGTYLVRYDGEVYWTTLIVREEAASTGEPAP